LKRRGTFFPSQEAKKALQGRPKLAVIAGPNRVTKYLRECCHLSTREIFSLSVRPATPASKRVLAANRMSPVKQNADHRQDKESQDEKKTART
jgi:hypothetical protein